MATLALTDGQLEAIRKINASVVKPDGTIKSFKEQLLEYEYGYFNATMPFIVSADSHALLQSGAKNYPITMAPGMLVKFKEKHDLYPRDIAELPTLIEEKNVLMMDSYTYPDGGLVMYLDERGNHDIPLFAAFHLDKLAGRVSINEFMSIYERSNIEFTICQTWEKGLRLFPNEKTESWLQSFGLQLPDEVASFLNGNYKEVAKASQIPADIIICHPQGFNKNRSVISAGQPGNELGAQHRDYVTLNGESRDMQSAKDALLQTQEENIPSPKER